MGGLRRHCGASCLCKGGSACGRDGVGHVNHRMKQDVHDGVGHVSHTKRRKVDDSGSNIAADWRGESGEWRLLSPVVTRSASDVNMHIRDRSIEFEEAGHRYILHRGTDMQAVFPISVSGLWARYFEEFDAERQDVERVSVWGGSVGWRGRWLSFPRQRGVRNARLLRLALSFLCLLHGC